MPRRELILDKTSRGATIRSIDVGGRPLRVVTWRLGAKSDHPPLLFFNGIGANAETIAPLAKQLNDRAFVTVDMPGIGRSPDCAVPYNLVSMAWGMSRVLKELGLDTVDVMGFSWGGALAQQFALQCATYVRKVVLAATFPGMFAVPGDPMALARTMVAQHRRDAGYFSEAIMSERSKTALVAESDTGAMLIAPSARGLLYQLLAITGWTSLPFLPFLSKPVLVVAGEDDRIVPPANTELLARAIPGAERVLIPGAEHMLLLTHTGEVVSRLRAFLDRAET